VLFTPSCVIGPQSFKSAGRVARPASGPGPHGDDSPVASVVLIALWMACAVCTLAMPMRNGAWAMGVGSRILAFTVRAIALNESISALVVATRAYYLNRTVLTTHINHTLDPSYYRRLRSRPRSSVLT
jgi:hypothetical protein